MRMRTAFVLLLVLAQFAFAGLSARAADNAPADLENTLYLDLDAGRVVIHMRPDLAPKHVERIKHLTRGGFYDGLAFHRVIAGFMAQTGDPKGNGTGGSGRMLEAEFTSTPQVRGIVSMARAGEKNSGDSQWFIVLADSRAALDGKYTVWGEVTSGMEFVDKIRKGDANRNGAVTNPDHIVRLQVAADADHPSSATPAELLKMPEAAATARNFSGAEFKCSAIAYGPTVQTALARVWTHGYMAGYYKAKNKLAFVDSADTGMDSALRDVCKTYPKADLLMVSGQELVRSTRDMPGTTDAFSPATYTCKDYTAARGANTASAEITDMWAMAFIQGYKNVGQPDMEIPFDARTQILGALASACAKNPNTGFAELTGLLANKMKLK